MLIYGIDGSPDFKAMLELGAVSGTSAQSPKTIGEVAVKKETESFLKRVYQGSVSMLVSGFVERQRLSPEELAQLRDILDRAEEERNE